MTSYVFMWEQPDGERRWEAVKKGQCEGFIEKLIENQGVHPATIMVAYAPILFHWVFKKYHIISDVNFHKINEEIYGTEPIEKSKHKPVDVPNKKEKPIIKYGWLSPDGRFFNCDYGGHSTEEESVALYECCGEGWRQWLTEKSSPSPPTTCPWGMRSESCLSIWTMKTLHCRQR